jgi:glycosyltransferase involved in cell wall biosynthesis
MLATISKARDSHRSQTSGLYDVAKVSRFYLSGNALRRRGYSSIMIHLFVNSLAASAGGGLTYSRNVIPHLAANPEVRVTAAVGASLREELPYFPNVDLVQLEVPLVRRFWYEQSSLPRLLRRSGADVLLSTGNFALRNSPVPQILLSRNSVYTSADFSRDLLSRHEYRAWIDLRFRSVLARRSIHWADATVAPSEAFAAELKRWSGAQIIAIHHGFDRTAFVGDPTPLAPDVEAKLRAAEGSLKILFVSHYNYYRNFETLIRALPLMRDQLAGRRLRLLLTCQLAAGKNPGAYRPEGAAQLVKELGVSDVIAELGTIPYPQLHHLYARADLYVTAAYTETFAHPLVEAMSSGVPVIASDIPVHREICGDAGAYFPHFSAESLADKVAQVATSPETAKRMAAAGLARAQSFSWKTHVEKILELAHRLVDSKCARNDALAHG